MSLSHKHDAVIANKGFEALFNLLKLSVPDTFAYSECGSRDTKGAILCIIYQHIHGIK